MPITSIPFVLIFSLLISITAPARADDSDFHDDSEEVVQQHVDESIALITSLFSRPPVPSEHSAEALQVRDDYVEELVAAYSHAQPDAQPKDLEHFRNMLKGWGESLPAFPQTIPAGSFDLDAKRPQAISEKARENYIVSLGQAMALSMSRLETAKGTEKNILQQISIRIFTEAFLVASLTEPSNQDIADKSSRFLLGPLFVSFAYPLALAATGQEVNIAAGGFAMGIMTIFLQNTLAQDSRRMKPWFVPSFVKRRAHTKRADGLIRIFLAEFVAEMFENEAGQIQDLNFDFEKMRKTLLNKVLAAHTRMSNLSAEDCNRALRD